MGTYIGEFEKTDVVVLWELADEVSEISDPRDETYVRHKLGDIMLTTLFAVMVNANKWIEMEMFGKKQEAWLRTFLELPHGIPTGDTFRVVLSQLNANYAYELIVGFLIRKPKGVVDQFKEDEEGKEKEILSCDGKISASSKMNATDMPETKALNTQKETARKAHRS